MNRECARIADQLRRALTGAAWHGSSLQELLAGVTSDQAVARPVASAHSIWELVGHIEVWIRAAAEAVEGVPVPKIVGTDRDWPRVAEAGAETWSSAAGGMFAAGAELADAIGKFDDARLGATVPGRPYDFYFLFHGVVQHSLYHGGQIALLKKALSSPG